MGNVEVSDVQIKKMKWPGKILQSLYPLRCPGCDEIVTPYGQKVCSVCLTRMKLLTPPWCMRCGKKLLAEKEICEDCARSEHVFVRGRALYEYDSIFDSVYRFKYGNRQEYADFFGEQMAVYLGDFLQTIKPDGIVPIPLHKKREKQRGYNQAFLLAKALSKYTGIPVYKDLVIRVKNTAPLKCQKPKERQNNLKKAFNVKENDVKLERVLLVDDIYTTGSTMDEVCRTLGQIGVKEVYFITLAGGAGI